MAILLNQNGKCHCRVDRHMLRKVELRTDLAGDTLCTATIEMSGVLVGKRSTSIIVSKLLAKSSGSNPSKVNLSF